MTRSRLPCVADTGKRGVGRLPLRQCAGLLTVGLLAWTSLVDHELPLSLAGTVIESTNATEEHHHHRSPSPFQQRYPDVKLPHYVSKARYYQEEPPVEEQGCFIHVGKSAGSTIGCALGFHLHCDKNLFQYSDDLLARRTWRMWHVEVDDCQPSSPYALMALRHPLWRLQSAFLYNRPRHGQPHIDNGRTSLYFDCGLFQLDDLAVRGLGGTNETCQRIAFETVTGIQRHGTHVFFNYGHYYRKRLLDERQRVLVIRSEHLLEDWISADHALGGNSTGYAFPQFNVHERDPADYYLSAQGQELLCRALCQEVRFYQRILERAENLSPAQVAESMNLLYETCPPEALVCPVL